MTELTRKATGQEPRRVGRSVGAVFAGLAAIFVLSIGVDAVLHVTGVYPPMFTPMSTHLWVLALAYRIVFGVFGAWLTARIAPSRPMKHAMILGVIGVVLSAIGAAVNWNKGAEYGPIWFNLGLVAISLPCSWAGAALVGCGRREAPPKEAP